MTWLNLTMSNQKVKNGLKAKKIKLPPNELPQTKFSCTYWPLSFCKIFKKILGPIQSYEDVPFSGLKWLTCHEQKNFGTNYYYYFHLPVGPFHCAKFKKNSYSGSWVMRMHHFWDQKSPFAPNEKKFFGKILLADPVLWGYAIFEPKMAHLPKWEFFSENVLMSLVSFIHANLHTKNQSQILIY